MTPLRWAQQSVKNNLHYPSAGPLFDHNSNSIDADITMPNRPDASSRNLSSTS